MQKPQARHTNALAPTMTAGVARPAAETVSDEDSGR